MTNYLAPGIRVIGMFSAMVLGFASANASEDWEKKLAGAWTLSDNNCADIFIDKGGHWEFRQPVDMYGRSVIVEGREVRGPEATCRIVQALVHEDEISLVLGCRNTLSFMHNSVHLRIKGDNQIDQDVPGLSGVTVSYKKCSR
jgi:hypothetical protein